MAYRHRAAAGVAVEPTLQYLVNHATDRSQSRSWYAVVRFELAF